MNKSENNTLDSFTAHKRRTKCVAYERHNKLTMHQWIELNQKYIKSNQNWIFLKAPSANHTKDPVSSAPVKHCQYVRMKTSG